MLSPDHPVLRYPLSWRSWRFRLVASLLILVFTVRLIWGSQAERMLQRQLDAARARGEPVKVEDVKFQTLPDSENAWKVQVYAIAALVPGADSPGNSNDDFNNYPPYSKAWLKRAETSENAHARVFALARQARGLPQAQIRSRLTLPLLNSIVPPEMNQARQLGHVLCDGAIYSHLRGDDPDAIERILDAMCLARSIRQDPVLVSQLVATGLDSMANNTSMVIAPGLRFSRSSAAHPASAALVRQMIAHLLDEQPVWKQFAASLPVDRLYSTEFFDTHAKGTWLIHPLETRERIRANQYLEIIIEASQARTEPAIMAVLSRAWPEEPMNNPMSVLFGSKPRIGVPRYSRWFLAWSEDLSRYFRGLTRAIADRRATAVSLAAQLYRADHTAWPAKLNDLVPAYLSALPSDPFHDDGRPLGYVVLKGTLSDGADRPMVFYDAGPDQAAAVFTTPMYGWPDSIGAGSPKVFRQYRDLSRFAPPPPSTQTINHDPQKPNTPRK